MRKLLQNNSGFTLMEMLVAVAILAVLATVGLSFAGTGDSVRQYQLDGEAQSLCARAQNRLTVLYSSGQEALFVPDEALGVFICDDCPSDWTGESFARGTLLYIRSGSPAAALLFPDGVRPDFPENGRWLVEYDPAAALVYAAFYSEDDGDFYDSCDLLRLGREQRMEAGAAVGYYGKNAA